MIIIFVGALYLKGDCAILGDAVVRNAPNFKNDRRKFLNVTSTDGKLMLWVLI